MAASPNVTWQQGNIARNRRWQALGARGATVWLTGLPAPGKSTLGAALEQRLVEAGRFAYLPDGDNLRHGLCGDLGFSEADRTQNMIRAGDVVDTPLEGCMSRDPKELHARARAGEIEGFPGVDESDEPPAHPELVVRPGLGVAGAVDAALSLLHGAGAPPGAPGKEQLRRRSHRGPGLGAIHQRNGVKR